MIYQFAADLTALTHFAFLLFVTFGAFLGHRKRVWRYLHLASMVYAVSIEVFLWYCPLTYLEQYLRDKAGAGSFAEGFIAHYLNKLIYITAPRWSLILAAVVVLAVNLALYFHWSRQPKNPPSRPKDSTGGQMPPLSRWPLVAVVCAVLLSAQARSHEQSWERYNRAAAEAHEQGRYAEAGPLHRRALAIREKVLEPEDAEVLTSLNNLAELYSDQRQYDKAEPLYQRALAIREKALGPEHPAVAKTLENYAALLRKTNREDEAAQMEARAQAIRAKGVGRTRKPERRGTVGVELR